MFKIKKINVFLQQNRETLQLNNAAQNTLKRQITWFY